MLINLTKQWSVQKSFTSLGLVLDITKHNKQSILTEELDVIWYFLGKKSKSVHLTMDNVISLTRKDLDVW
jgi:hypothetical protein